MPLRPLLFSLTSPSLGTAYEYSEGVLVLNRFRIWGTPTHLLSFRWRDESQLGQLISAATMSLALLLAMHTHNFTLPLDHVVPFLRKWRVGFGFHGEQGAESLHASFNQITRSYTGLVDETEVCHERTSPADCTSNGRPGACSEEEKIVVTSPLSLHQK